MSAGSRGPLLIVALLGATAVMISPITPWPTVVAVCGVVLVVAGVAALIWMLLRNSNW